MGTLFSAFRRAHLLFTSDWARLLNIQCCCGRVHSRPKSIPIYTPGSEEQVRVKCLAQGHNTLPNGVRTHDIWIISPELYSSATRAFIGCLRACFSCFMLLNCKFDFRRYITCNFFSQYCLSSYSKKSTAKLESFQGNYFQGTEYTVVIFTVEVLETYRMWGWGCLIVCLECSRLTYVTNIFP